MCGENDVQVKPLLGLYIFGSEDTYVCQTCEMRIVNFVRIETLTNDVLAPTKKNPEYTYVANMIKDDILKTFVALNFPKRESSLDVVKTVLVSLIMGVSWNDVSSFVTFGNSWKK